MEWGIADIPKYSNTGQGFREVKSRCWKIRNKFNHFNKNENKKTLKQASSFKPKVKKKKQPQKLSKALQNEKGCHKKNNWNLSFQQK